MITLTMDLAETPPLGVQDSDGEYRDTGTLEEAIIAEAARQLRAELKRDLVKGLREEISRLRQDEIRAQLAPIVTEALHQPIRQTNTYGEPTGPETTLRALVVKEVRRYLEEVTGHSYDRDRGTRAEKLVQTEVDKVVGKELRAAVTEEKAKAAALVREKAAEIVTEAIAKAAVR